MICPKCGKEIADGSKFCPGCGSDLTDSVKNNQGDLNSLQAQQPSVQPQQSNQSQPMQNQQPTPQMQQPPQPQYQQPQYGQPQAQYPAPPKKKKKGLMITLIVIGAIILLIIIIAASSGGESSKTSSKTVVKPTATAVVNEADFKASCIKPASYDDLARNPDNYIGKNVAIKGKIIQVQENGLNIVYRMNITQESYGGWTDDIYIEYKKKSTNESRILEDDIVTIYGIDKGIKKYDTTSGSSRSIPYIVAQYVER